MIFVDAIGSFGMIRSRLKDRRSKKRDRRRYGRKRFRKNLSTAACKTSGRAFIALISDISSHGAFIKTHRRFMVGEEVAMTITFPATGESRMVNGKIVRLSPKGVGVNFTVYFKNK